MRRSERLHLRALTKALIALAALDDAERLREAARQCAERARALAPWWFKGA